MSLGVSIEDFIKKRRISMQQQLPGPLGDFYRAGGNEQLLAGVPVTSENTVLDVGAFEGRFTTEVCWRLGARCIAVEPVPSFCATLRDQFANNHRVRILEAAVGAADGEVELLVQGDGTTAYSSLGGQRVRVAQIDAARLVAEVPIPALLKLNVEGAEYDALDRLLDAGLLGRIRSILVQFHRSVPDCDERRNRIRYSLSQSHREVFCYPFVWERWDIHP
jgi:FkbM family methyltransferase